MRKQTILVTGATGAQGGSVAEALLAEGKFSVRCLTRNITSKKAIELQRSGAEVVEGDFDDIESLEVAMHGCYGVFGVTNFWEHFDKEYQQGKNLIDTVYKTGIEHFIYSSLPGYKKLSNGELAVPHCDIKAELEEYSKSLGLKATYAHIAFYYENFLTFFPPQKQEDGSYSFGFPQGDTKLSMVSVDDFGPVIAKIFENREAYLGKVVGVVGEDKTCAEYAEIMSEVFEEKIRYNYIPRKIFASFGFPGAEELANMFDFQRRYVLQRQHALEDTYKLNPATKSFKKWLIQNKHKFNFIKSAELIEA